mmetsp:Transcript_126033/g.327301  ORF Transcript_126033/g.327301 Transcript_126033/m.327301 type:complete len:579 (-) Transcript_126033:118-1854(-)
MWTVAPKKQSFAFVFPQWVGHLNPSLPIARRLRELGHEVHYVCHEFVRDKIEATGATFHSAVGCHPELYNGRGGDFFSMFANLKEEFGVEPERTGVALWQLRNVMVELQLPGLLRLFRDLKPDGVVFCPLSSPEGGVAAEAAGVPSIALNTFAGPGALTTAVSECLAVEKVTLEDLDSTRRTWAPNLAAIHRLRRRFGVRLEAGMPGALGYLEGIASAAVTLTTTLEELQDPMSPELEADYNKAGATFAAVGPLLDNAGGWRPLSEAGGTKHGACDYVAQAQAARAAGRPVVLVSMGTVVTGDMPFWGWRGRATGADGRSMGLSGKELCHAAWAAAFDAFGTTDADKGALILVSVGTQPDALDGISCPANAVCSSFLPQVDILRAGVDIFLTHGGQNSFTESLAQGVPVVVCPGFSDQIVNSRKAVALGVGLKVDRPNPQGGQEAIEAAIAQYREDVHRALLKVFTEPEYHNAARGVAHRMRGAGGVTLAVDLVLQAAGSKCSSAPQIAAGGQEQEGVKVDAGLMLCAANKIEGQATMMMRFEQAARDSCTDEQSLPHVAAFVDFADHCKCVGAAGGC